MSDTGKTYSPTERSRVRRGPKRAVYDRDTVHAIIDEAVVCHRFRGRTRRGCCPRPSPASTSVCTCTATAHAADARDRSAGVHPITHLDRGGSAFHSSSGHSASGKANGACKRRALDALVESIVPGRRGDLRPPTAQELAVTAVLEFPLEEVSAKVRTGPPAENKGDYLLPFWGGVVPLRMVAGAPESDAAAVRARIAPPPYLGREGERDVPDSPGTRLAARFRRRPVAWSTARSDTPPGAARRR